MKKYSSLGEFLIDLRKNRKLSQLDFAAIMDVDSRTVIRWEKNESLIKTGKERKLIEKFRLPDQVVRNLNTDKAIPIYFDFFKWVYSLSIWSSKVPNLGFFRDQSDLGSANVENISKDEDLAFLSLYQKNQHSNKPISENVVKAAAKILPELNIVLLGSSGYHSGHISVLPLKYKSYLQLREKTLKEGDLSFHDLNTDSEQSPFVYYYYSIYANSLDSTYFISTQLFSYFRKYKNKDYIFAGISYRYPKIDRFKGMGLKAIWEENSTNEGKPEAVFLEGNLTEFLLNEEKKSSQD